MSPQNSIQSETSTLASGSSTSSLRRTSIDTTPSSVGSAASSLRRISLDNSSTSPLIPDIEEDVPHQRVQRINAKAWSTDASTIRRACRYDCFCICHKSSTAVSSGGVTKRSELKHQCNEVSCQGAGLSEDEAVIPSFFRKAIVAVMSSRNIKVRYNLNTYRMVSEGSDALRYVKHGNLEKLKTCIQTGEATLWDTAPDGWSLLHVRSSSQNSWKS